jgi:FixJ family two-component response regulator
LSPREREVLGLLLAGMLNKQIASELGTTEKTIKVHRGRVMEKMRAGSMADLVWLAGKVGLR